MKIHTPKAGQSISYFECELCKCKLVPLDKGVVFFDSQEAINSHTQVHFSCKICSPKIDSKNSNFSSKDLTEFIQTIH